MILLLFLDLIENKEVQNLASINYKFIKILLPLRRLNIKLSLVISLELNRLIELNRYPILLEEIALLQYIKCEINFFQTELFVNL